MQATYGRANTLCALIVLAINSQLVCAATVTIPHTDRGWYRTSGGHLTNNLNYLVGDTPNDKDTRNFFVFNLSGVSQPVVSAILALYVPGAPGDSGPGYNSPDGREGFELHDVVTPISSLVNGTGGAAAHTDLGTGVFYGSRSMSAADNGSIVEITLSSAAVAAINANHGLFGIGGWITSLDDLLNNEHVFAYTNPGSVTELRLTTVPEPSSIALSVAAFAILCIRRRRS